MSETNGSAAGGAVDSTAGTGTPATDVATTGQTQAQVAAEIRKYKVKIDGQEAEVDETELINNYQTRKASDKSFREGQAAKKQAEQFAGLLKSDFLKVLESPELGLTEDQIIDQLENYMYKKYQMREMPEEQRKLVRDSEELQRLRKEQADQSKQADEEKAQKLQQHYAEQYSKQFVAALETSGLPKTERTIRAMVGHMTTALQNGLDVTPQEIAHLVREDYEQDHKSLYQAADPATLIKLLGEDKVKQIINANIASMKTPMQNAIKNTNGVSSGGSSVAKKGKSLSKQEWREKMDRIKSGKDE